MGLNAAQKEAVEYLEGPLLVLAGPGTGKTQLLSEKVAYILQNTDTNPENILCLTFTESGASNMRERLHTMIKTDALKVNIHTYHAFGTEILAQYKNYATDFDRGLDEAIDEVKQFKIVKALQEALPPRDILRGDSISNIIGVISEAKAAGLSSDDLAKIAEQNRQDAEVISESISPLLQKAVPRNYEKTVEYAYQPIFKLLENYHTLPPIAGRIERCIAGMSRDLAVAMEEAAAISKAAPLRKWRDKYFEKDEAGNYRLNDRVANLKLASVARLMADYSAYLREHKLYDFGDMIQEALQALNNDEGFRLTLEERYQYVMLDEFQDTNPSQFAIVKALTDYEKPNIMAVGDDDQAIYEFQGAMATNMTDFRDYYHAKVITLTENYRSTQEILDFSREIIKQAPDRFADKELTAHKPTPQPSHVHRLEFAGSDSEYAFVADKIAELVKGGVPQKDIAVISHKRKYFEPLLPYLKAHPSIKIAYEKRDNLLENQQIHEILTILRFVDDLAHERKPSVQLLEILTYPYFELPTLEILQLASRARADHRSLFEVLSTADPAEFPSAEKFKAAAEFLAKLIAALFVEPLSVVINELMQKMQPLGGDTETFTFYENVAALIGLVQRHIGDKTLKVADLLATADDYEAANKPMTVKSPYREADDAVQILTAHKAKGLEFSYVFIITTDHAAWGKGKGNNNLLTLPKNLMQIRHTGITDSEQLRVLYVALTRAKDTLYITNAKHDFNDKSPERLEYFAEYVEESDDGEKVISPYLPSRIVEQNYDAAPVVTRTANLQNWLAAYRPETPELRALYQTRVAHWRMSASALTTFIDIAYAGPQSFFKSYVLRAPREPVNESIALGDLVHATFEAVTNQGLSDAEAAEFYLSEIDKQDMPSAVATTIKNAGTAGLMRALERFGDILRTGEAEVNLASEQIVVNGIPITGKLDHIIIDEDAKTIEIYDFKTSDYHKEGWGSHRTLYKYMLQLEFYRLLLTHSKKYSKYKVSRAHILFVNPDTKNNDEVYDKVYEFSPETEQELLSIMQAVYYEVSTLHFIDDPELMISPDSHRSVGAIKDFVKLIISKQA